MTGSTGLRAAITGLIGLATYAQTPAVTRTLPSSGLAGS